MTTQTDQQLLRDYAESRSEAAFAELVRRHVDLVYSTAQRMVRDSHQAEDVTQSVFVAMAQSARQLSKHPVLSGWLHRTTRNLAANAVRSNVRRQMREQEAAAMNELLATESDASWEKLAPFLDAALGELSEPDRDALLLRYFERKSARDIARTFGISDEAAQKRVSRAVERLRELLSRRGIIVGASGLVILITANAVQAAPTGLTATISCAVVTQATVSSASSIAVTKTIAMTTIKKTILTATATVLVGAGIYEVQQASQPRPVPRTTPATETIKGQSFGRGQLVDAGNTTPEAAWESRYWARSIGDYDAVLAATDPRAVKIAKDWMGDKATFRARSQEEFASLKAFQILARKNLADDRVELKYRFGFKDRSSPEQIKIVEMVKAHGVWRCRETRAYDASWDAGSQPEPQG